MGARRLLTLLGAAAAAYGIYRRLRPEPMRLLPRKISSANGFACDEPGFVETLAAHVDAPVLQGNRFDLLINGRQIFPAMLAAIMAARDTVHLLSYVYWQGDIARRFAEELAKAARRGVEVRVLLDAWGAKSMQREVIETMRGAGCRVEWFNPPRWYSLDRFNFRTHRKILVADARMGFTGGVGIADEWTGDAQDPDHWRDNHFRIEGPAVRYLQGSFAENWRQVTGQVLSGQRIFPELESAGPATVVPLLGDPMGEISHIAFAYWLSIAGARRRLWLATPYFVPSQPLEEALCGAARRGCDVVLLLPGTYCDSILASAAGRHFLPALLRAGVRIYEYLPTMLHTKTLIADEGWAVVGSSNFDHRSFELNYEITLGVRDRALVRELAESFEHDLGAARPISPELAARRRSWRSRAALLLRHHL